MSTLKLDVSALLALLQKANGPFASAGAIFRGVRAAHQDADGLIAIAAVLQRAFGNQAVERLAALNCSHFCA